MHAPTAEPNKIEGSRADKHKPQRVDEASTFVREVENRPKFLVALRDIRSGLWVSSLNYAQVYIT